MLKLAVFAFLCAYAYAAYYEELVARAVDEVSADPETYGFEAGHNEYLAGRSEEQLRVLMGTKMDGKSASSARTLSHPESLTSSMPSSFTVGKDKWSKCAPTVNYVKDQADCGSCWAVAASSVIADRTCIQNEASIPEPDPSFLNENKPQIDMSAAQIMSCCGYCGQGCHGGYPIDAMRYWRYSGDVTGGWYGSNCGCQPYPLKPCGPSGCHGAEVNTPRCSKSCRAGYGRSFSQDEHKASDYYNIRGNAANIQAEIYKHGSVECAFTVYENFMAYKSGVYKAASGKQLGGHAVRLIGWGEEGGVPYWRIQNSWNVTWGMNGAVLFKRGVDLCGMESQCVAGIAKSGDSNINLSC